MRNLIIGLAFLGLLAAGVPFVEDVAHAATCAADRGRSAAQ